MIFRKIFGIFRIKLQTSASNNRKDVNKLLKIHGKNAILFKIFMHLSILLLCVKNKTL